MLTAIMKNSDGVAVDVYKRQTPDNRILNSDDLDTSDYPHAQNHFDLLHFQIL